MSDWFNLFAFTNYVAESVGDSTNVVSDSQLNVAKRRLREILKQLEPKAVLVLGIRQEFYSRPVLIECGVPSENIVIMNPHPGGEPLKLRWHKALEAVSGHYATGQRRTPS